MRNDGQPILQLKNISKSFPGVKALNQVSLSVHAGEILGLVGENGAGKSTLMKVLTGAYQKDEGEIYLEGQPIDVTSTARGRELGISIIYQELSVMPQLSVTENMFLGNLRTNKRGIVDWKGMEHETKEALSKMGLDIPGDTLMRDLNIAQSQMIEICRATIINKAKVLIMDEPTSSLVDREISHMFEIMRQLKKQGIAIVYITHRLEELFEITDRIEVMKDGENSASMKTADVTKDDIVHAMVGRELKDFYPAHDGKRGEALLEVSHLSQGKMVKDISFTAYAGEILGFAGLIGAGRSETMMSIFGAMPDVKGEVVYKGRKVKFKHPEEAIRAGIALAPEDRKKQGLIQIFSINHNTSLANMEGIFTRFKTLNLKKEREIADQYVKALNIRTPDAEKRVGELSGGNQQKVIVGKWMFTDAKVMIFDEPTKGIDVGAKAEIYRLMRKLANEGAAVIMISSELPEVIGVSDRIIVMHDGSYRGEFSWQEADEKKIMEAAIGGVESGK
ncbi:sugar ABC transporter ATP-binding protein [Anaerolentibacter hominis]|uniref:sugar ABC transporter ATP-binding protein n=1 Tax=Anaerolentibacter hominis TaxID=3079009 RepID=UPI0031B83647